MFKLCLVMLATASLSVVTSTPSGAATLTEDFSTNPLQKGWQVFGNASLFHWDPTDQNLAITWNSTNQNSYFSRPLRTLLAADDDFSLSFDLQVSNATASGFGFELAIGLLRWSDATNANFSRGGGNSPNLFEFDYYPPNGFGDPCSVDATLKDAQPGYAGFYFTYDNLPLNPGVTYHVTLTHAAGSPTISGVVLANGQPYTSLTKIYNGSPLDFRLDTLAVSSYQDDGLNDSIFAQGIVDNFTVTLPPSPVQNLTGALTNNLWQAQFISRSNWMYTLERTVDFQTWMEVSSAIAGSGTNLFLQDTNAPAGDALYRVRANRP